MDDDNPGALVVGSKTGVYLGVMWTEYQHLLVALNAPLNAYTVGWCKLNLG